MARRPSRPRPPRSAAGAGARTPGGAELTKARARRAFQQGDYNGAYQLATQAIQKLKADPALLHLQGAALSKLGSSDEALSLLERAAGLQPKNPAILTTLAQTYRRVKRFDDMDRAIDRILQIDPDYPQAIHLRAQSLRDKGMYAEAAGVLEPALARIGDDPALLYAHAELCNATGDAEAGAESCRRLLGLPSVIPDVRRAALYLLSRLLDAQGDYSAAFDAAAEANGMLPPGRVATAESVTRQWTRERLASIPTASDPGELPLLVIGMPRSGTTLLEQMLAAHPRIETVGECNVLPAIRRGENPANLDQTRVDAAATRYLDALRLAAGPETVRVIDKLPGNYMNLGLVSKIAPGAKIIHCRRDPRDTCLSCFVQNFGENHPYTADLRLCAQQYAEYLGIMEHWRRALDAEILDVRYAELVREPEAGIRRMLAFVGLEFDGACLRHHESKRAVTTASSAQIRRPVYTSSVERWRNYEDRLGPLFAALKEFGVPLGEDAEA